MMGREVGGGSKVLLLPGVGTGRVQAGVEQAGVGQNTGEAG